MALIPMKYVERTSAKGKKYFYYRRGGKRLGRLTGPEGSLKFFADYGRIHAAAEGKPVNADAVTIPGTFKAMAQGYLASPKFTGLSQNSQGQYRHHVDILIRHFGNVAPDDIRMSHILAFRDKLSATPGKANAITMVMRLIFGWGMARDHATGNPADLRQANERPFKIGTHQPWPEPLIQKLLDTAPQEVKWVVIVGLCTGQRIGDCLKMSWRDINNGKIAVTQQKTGKQLKIPIHRDLARLLETIPRRSTRILTTPEGRVWTYDNFRHHWRRARVEINALDFVFHGLRKNAVHRLLFANCSHKEAGSITGQTDQTVAMYAENMDQERLAEAGMKKLEGWQEQEKNR